MGKFTDFSDDEEDDNEHIFRVPSYSKEPPPKIPRQLGIGKKVFNFQTSWAPIYSCVAFRDEYRSDKLVVWILLPSGIGELGTLKVTVSTDGETLDVDVKWPRIMVDCDLMHAIWKNSKSGMLPAYHPKIMAIETQIEEMLTENQAATGNEGMRSTAKIPLPFPVQHQIQAIHKMEDRTYARMLYVELIGTNSTVQDLMQGGFSMVS